MLSLLLAILLPLAYGHFLLTYPPSIGFNDDTEAQSPCGGFEEVIDNLTTPTINITVENFAIELFSEHAGSTWLFQASIDTKAPFMWTEILPMVQETGLGDFCLPALSVPESFAGHAGVIQVIQGGGGELLYQCAVVNFIAGMNTTASPCYNGPGVIASFTNDTSTPVPTTSSTTAMTGGSASTSMSMTASDTMSMTSTMSMASASATSSMQKSNARRNMPFRILWPEMLP